MTQTQQNQTGDASRSEVGFSVTLIEAKPDVELNIGLTSGPLFKPSIIGRGEEADFRIADASVSRAHVRITPLEKAFLIESLSKNGSTFVNGEELACGDHQLVEPENGWLQLGKVLLKIEQLSETQPVSEVMSIPNADRPNFALIMVREGPDPEVWFGGYPAAMFPQAAKMLRALARHPTQTLTYDEIGRESDPEGYLDAGGTNYAQLATYIRNAFIEACENGRLNPGDFGFQSEDPREVARKLIRNVRSVGYVLDTRSAGVLRRDDPPPRDT